MNIGILKESEGENRVVMTPDIISNLIDLNNKVYVEEGSGEQAFFSDDKYNNAGAQIVKRNKILSECQLILSINPPELKDLDTVVPKTVIVSVFNPFFAKETLHKLVELDITSFSLDLLPRTTRAQAMDILSSMATVAGYKAVIEAAGLLPKFFPMFMSAAGTIKPAKMLILGAGVAGLQALSIGRKLGAVVNVFDVRSAVRDEVMSLGGKFIEIAGAIDDAKAGGYAVEQTEDYKQKQAQTIHDYAVQSDVVICTAQIPGKKAPLLIRKETVEKMVPGSVIIDLAASTGGNCEMTQNNKIVKVKGIKIVGKSNYPSDMPVDASFMFGKNMFNFIKLLIGENQELVINFDDEIIKGTCLTHNKEIVNERIKNIA